MARHPPKYALNHSSGRTLAAVVGAVPVALALGIALTLALPLPMNERLLLGSYAVAPLWAFVACGVFLAPSGRRAWLWLGVACALAALVAGTAVALGRGAPPAEVTS